MDIFESLLSSPPSKYSTLLDQILPGDHINDLLPVILEIPTSCTVLYYACAKGNLKLVQSIALRNETRLDGPQDKKSNYSPFRAAYMAFEVEIVAQLLLLGVTDPSLSPNDAMDLSENSTSAKEKPVDRLCNLLETFRDYSVEGVALLYPVLKQYVIKREKRTYSVSESEFIIQWKWQKTGNVYADYDKESNQKIEEAYQSKKTILDISPTYLIDITKMLQYNNTTKNSRQIRREKIPVVFNVSNSITASVDMRPSFSSSNKLLLSSQQPHSVLRVDEFLKTKGKNRLETTVKPLWYYEESKNNFLPYSNHMQVILEKGYKNYPNQTTFETTEIVTGNIHIINFSTMEQINKITKKSYKILREEDSLLNSLYIALETILRKTNRLKEDENIVPIIEQYLKKPDCQTPYILSAVADIYNFHVVVLLCCYEKIEEKKFYARDNAYLGLPYLYLAYDGFRYDAILDDDEVPSEPRTTTEQIIQAITDSMPADQFAILLSNLDPSDINTYVKTQIRECTPLYLAARGGRTDLVTLLMNVPGIIIDGPQDIQSKSSPLHVASWYGYVGIIAILLYKGADPKNPPQNASGESSDKLGNTVQEGVRSLITEIWTLYYNNDMNGIARILQEIQSNSGIFSPLTMSNPGPNTATYSPLTKSNLGTQSLTMSNSSLTLEQLCSMFNQDILPSDWRDLLIEFKRNKMISKINEVSTKLNMTLFYICCRQGHYDAVKELSKIPELKMNGIQMYALQGKFANTPMHVATFRGHYRIVAFLIEKNVPQEANIGDLGLLGPRPSEDKIADDLDPRVRNIIQGIFQIDKVFAPDRKTKILQILQEKNLPSIEAKSAIASLIKNNGELPPHYYTFDYIFYESKSKSEPVLFELHITSVLNVEYKKYLYDPNDQSKEVDVAILCPPNWTSSIWKVNFCTQVAITQNGQEKKFFFNKKHRWTLNLVSKKLTMKSPKGLLSTFNACNEEQMKRICSWDPLSIKLMGRGQNLMNELPWHEATLITLDSRHEDFKLVIDYFHATVPRLNEAGEIINQIVKIDKILFPKNRSFFETRVNERLQNHVSENLAWTTIEFNKLLWHGTGNTHPEVLYKAEGAWNVAYATVNSLWGKGLYFASDANYSASYAYKNKLGNKMLFLAQVRVGRSLTCTENKQIIKEPPGFDSIVGLRGYPSIQGHNPMSVNYVVYDNAIALPVYLVEWKEGLAKKK